MKDTLRNSFTEPLRAMVRPQSPPTFPTPWSFTHEDVVRIHDVNGCEVAQTSTDDLAEIICLAVNEWASR